MTIKPRIHVSTHHALRLFAFGLLILLSSCQANMNEPLAFSPKPACQNFGELERAEAFIFQLFTENLTSPNYEDYIPAAIRQDFVDSLQAKKAEVQGLSIPQMIAHFHSKGNFTTGINDELLAFLQYMDQTLNGTPDFPGLLAGIDGWIADTKTKAGLTCEEKHALVALYYLTKGVFKFIEETFQTPASISGGPIEERDGCSTWDIASCIYFEHVLPSQITSGAVGAISGALLGTGAAVGLLGGVLRGTLTGLISGISNASDCCDPDLNCHVIRKVTVTLFNCDPVARYTPIGFGGGGDVTGLSWNNFPNGLPAQAVTLPSSPSLIITQIDISKNVNTVITTDCSDNTGRGSELFSFNLYTKAREATGAEIWGPKSVAPGTTHDYGLYGPPNPNINTTWHVTNGTIVNDYGTFVRVAWDPEMETGTLQAEMTNTCPGGSVGWTTINVVSNPSGNIP